MTEKMTLTERINALSFETLTEAEFEFLADRARKSVRPASKGPRKPTKVQVANQALAAKLVEFVKENGPVTVEAAREALGLATPQKTVAILKASGLVKTEGKGKVKATWNVA